MKRVFLLAPLLVVAATLPAFAKEAPRPDIAAAVSAPGRAASDIKLDDSRKPADVLAFAGLKPGMSVGDVMAGAGYWTEIMARVVGPKGKVVAYEPTQFLPTDDKGKAVWSSLIARNPNVTQVAYPFDGFAAPVGSLDLVMMNLVYHDLYWESAQYKVPRTDPAAFLRVLYKAVKPGGTVVVIDHVAAQGDTRTTVEKLHRIDPAVVKADFKAAGFVLDSESDLLRNAGDDHSKLVFDPSVRGKTDRFVFRFRRPKKG
jgi:predicted methyltransferase